MDQENNIAALQEAVRLEDDRYLQSLLQKEISSTRQLFKWAHKEAMSWIEPTIKQFSLRAETVYMAMLYFDRFFQQHYFIDKQKTDSWLLRAEAAACLVLAAKMEGDVRNPPLLQVFSEEHYSSPPNAMIKAELLVLKKLQWRLQLVTPFTFIPYLVRKFLKDKNHPAHDSIVSRAKGNIYDLVKEINLAELHPSSIAAAAVLRAWRDKIARRSMEDELKNDYAKRLHLDIEGIGKCYQELKEMRRHKTAVGAKLLPRLAGPPI